MITLQEAELQGMNRNSSKGNQLKWFKDNIWYKADYAGYEGLAEYVISKLLEKSNLPENLIVPYETEEIHYQRVTYKGCKSKNFLPEGWQMLTFERVFEKAYGKDFTKSIWSIPDREDRLPYIVQKMEQATKIKDLGIYMSMLLTVDTFFLNEDRHMHNLAVLWDNEGKYHLCPFFDFGAGLLSDTTMDYPMGTDIYELIPEVEPKTFSDNFDEQLDMAEATYGSHLRFNFTIKDVEQILDSEPYYGEDEKNRIISIIREQRRKYKYLIK